MRTSTSILLTNILPAILLSAIVHAIGGCAAPEDDNGDVESSAEREDARTIQARLTRYGHIAIYGVKFDYDEAVVKPESKEALQQIAQFLKENSNIRLAIVGHTDAQGDHEHNMELSKQRADAVVKTLIEDHEIIGDRLFPAGVGFLAPIAKNETESGRAQNRRVELVFLPSKV